MLESVYLFFAEVIVTLKRSRIFEKSFLHANALEGLVSVKDTKKLVGKASFRRILVKRLLSILQS